MPVLITELFYRDDVSKEITSISCGNVWLWFYKEALVAVTHVVSETGLVEAVMVKESQLPPIAYKSYTEWFSRLKAEGNKIAVDSSITLDDFKGITADEIQAYGLRWLGDQISQIVQDKLTNQGE